MENKKRESKRKHCCGLTKQGKPCKAAPMEGGLCFLHANPAKAAELGRIGGRKNGQGVAYDLGQLPRLKDVGAIGDAVTQLIDDVRSNRINPRAAAVIANLLQLRLRVMSSVELDLRLQKLEEESAKAQSAPQISEERPQPCGFDSVNSAAKT